LILVNIKRDWSRLSVFLPPARESGAAARYLMQDSDIGRQCAVPGYAQPNASLERDPQHSYAVIIRKKDRTILLSNDSPQQESGAMKLSTQLAIAMVNLVVAVSAILGIITYLNIRILRSHALDRLQTQSQLNTFRLQRR
jgi:hypothetical protein